MFAVNVVDKSFPYLRTPCVGSVKKGAEGLARGCTEPYLSPMRVHLDPHAYFVRLNVCFQWDEWFREG